MIKAYEVDSKCIVEVHGSEEQLLAQLAMILTAFAEKGIVTGAELLALIRYMILDVMDKDELDTMVDLINMESDVNEDIQNLN